MAKKKLPYTPDAPDLVPTGEFTALHFNAAEYLRFLEDAEGTDEQKLACLEALFDVMVAFVDMGFDIHPVQQALVNSSLESDSGDVVDSGNSEKTKKKNDESA